MSGVPAAYWFNPFAEGFIAYGNAYQPRKSHALLAQDLANLPQFFCGPEDIVLVPKEPSAEFLATLNRAGFAAPEFVELQSGKLPESISGRSVRALRPWAWGPECLELFGPLKPSPGSVQRPLDQCFNESVARLYSKALSAGLLKRALSQRPGQDWLCSPDEVGVAVDSLGGALETIRDIRLRGQHRIVIKQEFGVAGHNSVRLWEQEVLPEHVRWIEQALQGGRTLVIEPWLEREEDFSIQLEMAREGLRLCGFTGLVNDLKGQYQANWAAPDFAQRIPSAVISPLSETGEAELKGFYDSVFTLLEGELRRGGYEGPVGIDAFVYRGAGGRCRLKPVVEVNPRYTMGRVTVELMSHAASGCCGTFRLLTHRMVRALGFKDFHAYAQHLALSSPVRVQDKRIVSGSVCLNDPAKAKMCLAVFEVGQHES